MPPPRLSDVTRDFARGDTSLEALRAAARAERMHRHLADEILRLITEWENSGDNSTSSRNELRARAKRLVPPDPPPRKEPAESFYEPGLRGQKRRS